MIANASFSIADTHRIAFFYYSNEIAVIRNAILSLIQPKAEFAKQPLQSSAKG